MYKKVYIIISIVLLITSISLTIFNRIYAFPKAGADFIDFTSHFYDVKRYLKNNVMPTTGAKFQMIDEKIVPRVPGGFFYIHYIICYKLGNGDLEKARFFNFISMIIPTLIFLFWIYKRFGLGILSILSVLTLFNIYFVYTNNIFYNPNITLSLSFLFIVLLGEYQHYNFSCVCGGGGGITKNIAAMMFFPCLALMGQAHFAVYYGIVPTIIVYLIIRYKETIKNIKYLSIGIFISFLTYLPYLVSEIKCNFYNTKKMLSFSSGSELRNVFPFPQVHSLFMFPTNEFSVMYSANNFDKIMDFYLNKSPHYIFTLSILIISIVIILIAFIFILIHFIKNKNNNINESEYILKELFLIFLLYFPTTIITTIIGRGIAGQFRYHYGAFALSFIPIIYFLYVLTKQQKYKILSYISIFYILSAIAMTFNIMVFYKNYQEPYKWKDYIETVRNIEKDANNNKFIITNGNNYFTELGKVYNLTNWIEIKSNANIIYHLENNNNTKNINLPIISSNSIYIVYKEIKN